MAILHLLPRFRMLDTEASSPADMIEAIKPRPMPRYRRWPAKRKPQPKAQPKAQPKTQPKQQPFNLERHYAAWKIKQGRDD